MGGVRGGISNKRDKIFDDTKKGKEVKVMLKRMMVWAIALMMMGTTSMAFARDVYVTKNGKKFHEKTCSFIKNREVTLIDDKDAIEKGYKPCGKCFKKEEVKKK